MAYSAFGATAALLQSDMLPHYAFSATSSPTSTRVETIIARRAARVSGLVDMAGLDASALDVVGEPIAFYFCQRLTLVGAAIDVALAFTGGQRSDDLVEAWRKEWDEGIGTLRGPGLRAALADAVTAGTVTGRGFRSHVQHGSDVPSAAGDVGVDEPTFTQDMDL